MTAYIVRIYTRAPQGKLGSIELEYAYDFDGKPVERLTVRPPKVKDSRLASKTASSGDPGDVEIQLFANPTETTYEFVSDLHQEDYGRLQEAYLDFLPSQKEACILVVSLASYTGWRKREIEEMDVAEALNYMEVIREIEEEKERQIRQ